MYLKPEEFANEFIIRFRQRLEEDERSIANIRLGLNIARLLYIRYMQNRKLLIRDYIKIAELAVPLEYKKLAVEIAREILMGKEQPKKKKQDKGSQKKVIETSKEEIPLEELFKGIRIDKDGLDKSIDEIKRKIRNYLEFKDSIFTSKNDRLSLLRDLLEYIDKLFEEKEELFLKDPQRIVDDVINSLPEVIMDDNLSPQQIKALNKLGQLDKIISKTGSKLLRLAKNYLDGSESFHQELGDYIKGADINEIKRLIETMTGLGLDIKELSGLIPRSLMDIPLIEKIYDATQTLIGPTEEVYQNSMSDIDKSIESAVRLDKKAKTAITEKLIEKAHSLKIYPTPNTLQKLAEYAKERPNDIFRQYIRNALKYYTQEKPVSDLLYPASVQNRFPAGQGQAGLMPSQGQAGAPSPTQVIDAVASIAKSLGIQGLGDVLVDSALKALSRLEYPDQFIYGIRMLADAGLELPIQDVLRLGSYLGIPDDLILSVLNPNIEYIKKLIEKRIGSVNDYDALLDAIKLNERDFEELARHALKYGYKPALQALMKRNLPKLIQIASSLGKQAENHIISAFSLKIFGDIGDLTAGAGANILITWFNYRDRLTGSARRILKKIAKKVIIELSIILGRQVVGSREEGILPVYETRPYREDDDLNNMAIEDTLENLLSSGKITKRDRKIRFFATLDDLIVYTTRKGKLVFVFLLDTSGSMSGEKLASCAIAASLLAYRLRPEELAVATFSSDTIAVKELDEDADMEEIAEFFLELEAGGGTMISRALEWARKQFKNAEEDDVKILAIFSDYELFDAYRAFELIEKIARLGVRALFFYNKYSYNAYALQQFKKLIKGYEIELDNYISLPRKLIKAINKLFG